jgi:exopolyphosphatase/guanosine-5'-triphosphate,3'-diphosphate pyrophosphatase
MHGMSIVPPIASGPLAAIDIGSNSFRLEIGQMQHGRYRRIDYLKDTVRLGAGLDANGFLQEEAAQRGLHCLQRFAQRLAGFQPTQVRAVATQTLREARNRNAYLERAQQALGYPVEVISGREEARLIYAGVAAAAGDRHRRPLDRDDPRAGAHARRGGVVPRRQRQPVDAVLHRRAAQRSRVPRRPDRRRG